MTSHPLFLRLAVTAAGFALAGCAAGPNYRPPALKPGAGIGPAQALDIPGYTLAPGGAPERTWWRGLGSDKLNALIEQGLANSPTIESARAALRNARELLLAQKGAYWPIVSASLAPSRQAFAKTLASPLQSGSSLYSLTTTQLSVAYTPDLFGANRRLVEGAAAQTDQARYELEAARLSLINNIVLAAATDASLRAQIVETRALIDAQRRIYKAFEAQKALGQASAADLASQTAALAQAEALLPALERQLAVNRDMMAALVGKSPAEAPAASFDMAGFTPPTVIPVSLSTELLARRPDVRASEAALHAASAQIGVAVAARLPNVQIDAQAGSAAIKLSPSFGSNETFWSIAGSITQPIFAGGALLHRQRAAEAAFDQAKAQYRATVVGAFQSVADALYALKGDADTLRLAERASGASADALRIARRQQALGDISLIALLGAEQTDHQARVVAIQARAAVLADVAALQQALGGGWDPQPPGRENGR